MDSSFSLLQLSPPTKDKRNQCRTRPSLWLKGGLYPSWDGEQGWEMLRPECNRQHNDREEEKAKKVSSQEAQGPHGPCGQGAASNGEMLGEPQLHSGPETQAGGCKVWQFGLQVLVSIHHPGQLSASLGLCTSAP